jgi:hypothetical protein
MNNIPIQNVWSPKRLRASVTEGRSCEPARLYGQVLKAFRIEDMSMPVVSVGRDPPVPAYASVTHAA